MTVDELRREYAYNKALRDYCIGSLSSPFWTNEEETKETTMAVKNFQVDGGYTFETYDEAEKWAKRRLAGRPQEEAMSIWKRVANVVTPVPTFEVVKVD